MPTTISDYVTDVRTMIRDNDSTNYTFADPELQTFIKGAVSEYSTFRPRRQPFTLSMIAQQDKYTLPDDWMSADFEMFNNAINTNSPDPFDLMTLEGQYASFVLPNINNDYPLYQLDFQWYDSDRYVVVRPIPQSNATIDFAYYGYHQVDSTQSTVPQKDMDAVVMASSARALKVLAVDKGQRMQRYKIGQGLSIDDSQIAKNLEEQATMFHNAFMKHVANRPFGV